MKKLCTDCGKKTEQEKVGKEPDGDVYKCTECGKVYVQLG